MQRLTVAVAADEADRARGELADLVPAGWREQGGRGDHVAFDLWLAATDEAAPLRLAQALADRGVAAQVTSVPEGDEWRDGLRRHHRPVEIAGRLRVRPPWVAARRGLVDVVIDPGMAFGTGQHATTRGCLALLADLPPGSALDVGCGSGVLAIAARKLGHDPVMAVDVDPLAVEATARNAAANGVDVPARLLDAAAGRLPAADTILANITEQHVAALARRVAEPPRAAIVSGFRPADADLAVRPWRSRGYEIARRIDDGGWTALALGRP